MCTQGSKEVKIVQEKTPTFAIRDLVPEDLFVLPAENKPTSATDPKMDLTAFLANGTDGADKGNVSPSGPHEVTILPKPASKRIRRKYFPEADHGSQIHGNAEKDIRETRKGTGCVTASESILSERNGSQSQGKSVKCIPPQKLRPTPAATPFFDNFPPLPPTQPVPPIPSGDRKRKSKRKDTAHVPPVADQSIPKTSHGVEMGIAIGQRHTIVHPMKAKALATKNHLGDAFAEKRLVDYEEEPKKLLSEIKKNGHAGSVHCQADEIHST